MTTAVDRKRLGAWYTPPALVDVVTDGVLTGFEAPPDRPVRVVDPACGDGRLLSSVGDALVRKGAEVTLVGCDVDRDALAAIDDRRITTLHTDALERDWADESFDIVIGNPPFLSQMAAATTRGRSSRLGGGPYADAAVEFLALGLDLTRPSGRLAMVLPQSILGARDAADVRARLDETAPMSWAWWEPRQDHFDASVNVCVLGFERSAGSGKQPRPWTSVVTDRLGVPAIDDLATDGQLGDRADLNANFRDEYYALVPVVGDDVDGPPLVTSGLIDPGACHWGGRSVRFAKRRFDSPRVDVDRLEGRFRAWAERKLVPKVLVANQTRAVEAVADAEGAWLPGVPVTSIVPTGGATVNEIAAVLTSPVATVHAWHHGAGTGLSTTAVRVGPGSLASVPWPLGPLDHAVAALSDGNVIACGEAVCQAYGIVASDELITWWTSLLPRG